MKNIAIFASGSGSNAQTIVEYFKSKNLEPVKLILTNNPKAFVIERAKKLNIECIIFSRKEFYESNYILDLLKSKNIEFIVLAGFLWLVPTPIINAYKHQIINIHPALLPKYGGKGMYGMRVHEAVVANKESETGITIHYVDEIYDHGQIIFQASCKVSPTDTPEMVAEKVHQLEYKYYPEIIEKLIL